MADYYTQFSCSLDLGSPENAIRAVELFEANEGSDDSIAWRSGFNLRVCAETEPGRLYLDDAGAGDIEAVTAFVLRCAQTFDLQGLWGFEYANTCSQARLDGFGGGALVLELGKRETKAWLSTFEWLSVALNGGSFDA